MAQSESNRREGASDREYREAELVTMSVVRKVHLLSTAAVGCRRLAAVAQSHKVAVEFLRLADVYETLAREFAAVAHQQRESLYLTAFRGNGGLRRRFRCEDLDGEDRRGDGGCGWRRPVEHNQSWLRRSSVSRHQIKLKAGARNIQHDVDVVHLAIEIDAKPPKR
jgi:hypothetical protein